MEGGAVSKEAFLKVWIWAAVRWVLCLPALKEMRQAEAEGGRQRLVLPAGGRKLAAPGLSAGRC